MPWGIAELKELCALAAPSEFTKILGLYGPDDGLQFDFAHLNAGLRGGPSYANTAGARSWWAE